MKNNIRFENWKFGRVIVKRNEKGQLVTWRKQKNSNIKTKAQAIEIFTRTGSFNPQVIKIPKRSIKTKQTIFSKTKIGKNTYIIRSNKKIKSESYYQHVVVMFWGKKRQKTIGYSNMRGTVKDALERAIWNAIRSKIITYEWVVDVKNRVAYPPQKTETPITFDIKHEVATYVKSEGKWK